MSLGNIDCVMLGNFNINIMHSSSDFTQHICEPTRFPTDASSKPTFLDHIRFNRYSSGILKIGFTDLSLVFVIFPHIPML